jgi:Pyridoxamine 5'-phosphate oxidase
VREPASDRLNRVSQYVFPSLRKFVTSTCHTPRICDEPSKSPDPIAGSRPRARRVLPVILGLDLVELICGGVAVLVSTRDSDLQPEIVRAWGPEVSADGSSLTVCVPAAPGSRTAANLESNGEVAALFVSSTDYRAIQVKGRAESLTAPTPEQLQLIEQHVLAFAARVRELGVNEADIRRVVRPDPVAVRIAVRTGYDQTPGRGAGRPL